MARGSVTYSGTYNGTSAGANGVSLEITGSSIPSEKLITSIVYSIKLSADYASSSLVWRMVEMTVEGSNVSAEEQEVSMGDSNRCTLTGTCSFSRDDISAFSGDTITIHTKANCSGKPTSYMWEVSLTVNYKDVYEMSDVSAPSSVDAGSSIQVSLSNAELNEIKHTITCSIGSYSVSKSLGLGEESCEIEIPIEWCNSVTKSTSGTMTVTTKAYESDGTPVGTSSISVTMEVPVDVKPTIGSVQKTRVANSTPAGWGDVYIQNVTGITIEIKDCTPAYGSKIVSYVFGGLMSVEAQSPSCTMKTITESGTVAFTAKCVDERGRESDEYVIQVDVIPYSSPRFSGSMAYRCDSVGTSNEQGTYIRANTSVVYSQCLNASGVQLNGISLSCYYQKIGDEEWTDGAIGMSPDSFYTFGAGAISVRSTYQVKYVLSDMISTVEKIITVSTSQFVIFLKRGGTAIGIGKKCRTDIEYVIDISEDWSIWHGSTNITDVIKNIAGATIPDIVYSTSQPSAVQGRIWLKPK